MTELRETTDMQSPDQNGIADQKGAVVVVGVDNPAMDRSDKDDEIASESSSSEVASIREAYVKVHVTKPQMNQPEYDNFYGHNPRPKRSAGDVFRDFKNSCECSGRCIGKTILGFFPFIGIMKLYEKSWISADLIAGLTIGIMQIPQGLAYSLLASLDPVVGLYVSFFPVLIYYFFGTSRHVSLGTFAVISLMVGTTVEKFDCSNGLGGGDGENTTTEYTTTSWEVTTEMYENTTGGDDGTSAVEKKCKLQIATAVTLLAGVIQLAMGLLKIGFVVRYLSVPLTRGFTTGCAIHVFTSQVKYVLGITTDRYSGPLKLVYTYRDIFQKIFSEKEIDEDTGDEINNIQWAAVVLSIICMIILWVVKEYANPPFKKKFKAPIPIDLIIVIAGTLASYFGDFKEKYKLAIVGDIETGIPPPEFPPVSVMGDVALDAFFIAVVAFAISVSMSQLFADKYNYDVDPNQELVAHGICNAVSANFNCYVMCVSLSRTAVLDSIGVKTQVFALWSCALILLVIYFIAPYFGPLPNCVLAAIIIIALKGLFMQFKDIPKYWKISGTDLSVWLVTFVAVVIMDVGFGLVIGVLFCLLTVVGRTQKPYASILGKMPGTMSYKDVQVYKKAEEIKGIKVFRYDNAIYYANKDHFMTSLFDMSENNPKAMKLAIAKCKTKRAKDIKKEGISEEEAETRWPLPQPDIHHVVLDCSVISYTDAMGVIALRQALMEYKDIGVLVKYAAMNDGVREMLESGGFFEKAKTSMIYPTVHDAVYDALQDYPEEQWKLVHNYVDAPYLEDIEPASDIGVLELRKRTMSQSRWRARTLSELEKAGTDDVPVDRSASQEGFYNMALVVDDVMDLETLDEEMKEYEDRILQEDHRTQL